MAYRWKPSKTAKANFAKKMNDVDAFCEEHGISQSFSSDSYYFSIGGKNYRVSNHSVEASNRHAFDPLTGEKRRELYHPDGREDDVIYIHAGKTRIIEIYTDLMNGYELDGKGNRKSTAIF